MRVRAINYIQTSPTTGHYDYEFFPTHEATVSPMDYFLNLNTTMDVSNAFTNIFLTDGAYYRPSAIVTSPMTPDVFDFVHFAFCYFFLTAFLLLFWLVFSFDLLALRGENREPILETRGFSRAQTGDTLTAIIPLT
jgi:hypothetical protein